MCHIWSEIVCNFRKNVGSAFNTASVPPQFRASFQQLITGLPAGVNGPTIDTPAFGHLVDRPTQLIYIGISICWVGGGNPCGVADFCFSGVYCHKKQARSDFFSKYPCHVHEDCLEAQIGTKNWVKPLKELVFPRPLSQFLSLAWNVAATYQDK